VTGFRCKITLQSNRRHSRRHIDLIRSCGITAVARSQEFANHSCNPPHGPFRLFVCARICSLLLFASMCLAQDVNLPTDEGSFKIGVTVVSSAWLKGDIYLLNRNTSSLPKFKKLQSIGSLYTPVLNLPVRDFIDGFPGITDRFEWFAIDDKGRFWISNPGRYRFRLESDDGAILSIDEETIINSDGIHSLARKTGTADLTDGIHDIRISYFQGPRYQIALILEISEPGENTFHIFNIERFQPPADRIEDGSLNRTLHINSKKKSKQSAKPE
jgi:hypothetical protein